MDDVLPPHIPQSADLRGNEYGWRVSSFPDALARAEAHGYARVETALASSPSARQRLDAASRVSTGNYFQIRFRVESACECRHTEPR